MTTKDEFLYPMPPVLRDDIFGSRLQNFKTSVDYIVSLEINGKVSAHEAYIKIKQEWKKLKETKKEHLNKHGSK